MRRDVRTLKVWSHYVRKNFLVPSPVFFGSPRFNCSKRSSGSLPLGTGTGLVESCQNLRELNRVHRPVSRLTTFPGKVRRVGKPQSEGRSVQTNSRSINIAKPWILKILYGTNLSQSSLNRTGKPFTRLGCLSPIADFMLKVRIQQFPLLGTIGISRVYSGSLLCVKRRTSQPPSLENLVVNLPRLQC